ncbi:MAG TPA: T9SS type A sorting domain-containing protein [Candidatus Cloacimonadota bacterium]|nr:T9SS type A sorting domain-containing protein [Candidatus Cloacimonadota bacterium]
MKKIITLVVMLLCLQLWAQAPEYRGSTIVDSLYAIPELDGIVTADSSGNPFYINNWTYEFHVGDIGGGDPIFDNASVRAYISYPLPSIPEGYSLVNATMRLYQYTSRGHIPLSDSTYVCTYFPVWDVAGGDTVKCIVSHIDYDISLGLDDWAKGDEGNPNTYNPNVGEITWQGINEPNSHGEAGYRYLDITDCVLHDLAIGSIFSQYRIAFQINTDYDYGPDFVAFKSMESNNEHQRPRVYYTLFNPTSVVDEYSPDVILAVTTNPNPFTSRLMLDLSLKDNAELSTKLYDLRGRVVKELPPAAYSKGTHKLSMETNDLPNGIYILQIRAGSEILTKKITCLK